MLPRYVFLFLSLVIVKSILAVEVGSASTLSTTSFAGSIKDSDGKPLNGVFVSAGREQGTYTVTVYTDDEGRFRFPNMEAGSYKVTAHAPGFQPSNRTAKIMGNGQAQPLDFTLQVESRPSELFKQATSSEWLNSLPGTVDQKYSLSKNCGSCHHNLFQMRERHFTQPDWLIIIGVMERIDVIGELGFDVDKYYLPWPSGSKQDIADYLSQIQGPGSPLPKIQFYPRATGRATRAIITEYRVPRDNAIPHDVQVDAQGNVWYNDFKTDYLGRLDPKTGEFREYKLPSKPGPHPGSQDMFISEDHKVWVHQRLAGRTVRFDPKTGKVTGIWDDTHFDRVSLQREVALGTSMQMDLKTGEVHRYKFASSTAGYGTAVDSRGIGFRGGIADSDIKVLDPETGKVTNYRTPTPDSGPRRISLDGDDYLWFGEWFGGKIGRLDIKTGKISEYPVSVPFAAFYEAGVDPKNHIGWSFDWRNDRLDRVDPNTGEVVEFPMPTLDVEGRRTAVDPSTNPPSVWINGAGNGLIIRVQAP